MKKKIIYGLLLAVAMVTASSSFVSCKDYEGDNLAGEQERIASLAELVEQQRIALQNCSTNCATQHALLWAEFAKYQPTGDYATKADLNNYVSKAKFTTDSTNLANAIKTNATAIENLETALKNYVTLDKFTTDSTEFMRLIKVNELAAASAQKLAEQAKALAESDSVRIDGLQENYNTLSGNFNTFVSAWGDDLASAIAEVARVRAIANAVALDSAKWNLAAVNAQAAVDSLGKYMDSWNLAAINAQAALDSLGKYMDSWNLAAINAQAAKDSLDKYQAAWNNAVIVADKAYDFVKGTKFNNLQELINAYEQADQAMSQDISDLQEEVGKLKNTLAKQITGVIIQATYSPVLGNGSLPFSVQTNLLAAYAGKSTADVSFPTPYDEDYADGSAVITLDDQAYLQSLGFWPGEVSVAKGDYIINGTGNAGKVYLTVNPTNTDFTGTTFDLVNSAGQVSRMELSDLKPCKDVLNFGWTRAGATSSTSGFYEASATVTKENIEKLQANINVEMFQKAFKENLNSPANGTGYVSYTAMMDLARAVYSSLEPLQRNGIRATWMDDAMGVSRSYTSAFDIAATVVNPLGFGFTIPENKFTRFPVFDTEYLKNRFHLKGEVKLLTAKSKESGENVIFCEVLQMNLDPELKDVIYDADGNPTYWYNGRAVYYDTDWYDIYDFFGYEVRTGYAYIDMTELFEEIYGEINTGFATVNDLVKQANKRIDYMVSYIDRYNRKAVKANYWITNANNLLQPVLLWCDSENVGILGGMITGNYAAGTVIPAGGSVALVPTSYTLELLAPAYKKSLVVTNVYRNGKSAQGVKGSDWQDALVAVNDALQKGGFDLFEGQSLKNAFIFEAKPEYAGMTFEFAYTALDFTGQVAGRKFYLTVGE